MTGNETARESGLARLKNGLVLLFLLVPSAWMITTIPPLWRDVDAYNQLVRAPLVATFWGHGPAYCYLAKLPLLAGESLEGLSTNRAAPHPSGSSQPALTDTGVWLLIIGQHLALAGAVFYFIISITGIFWTRLGLALLWASNAVSYTFAHCVGTESLSVILIVLLVAQATRLIRDRKLPWNAWLIFGVVLWCSILTRHLNLCLIALLPCTFLFSWVLNVATCQATNFRRQSLTGLAVAILVALAAVGMSTLTVKGLARKTRFHPHSRMGYTFLWRLSFLETLSPEARNALLQRLASQTHSVEARNLLGLLNQMMEEERAPIDWASFMNRAVQQFYGPYQWESLDRGLNQLSIAFLVPPAPELWQVARADFMAALKTPSTEVSSYLFDTTAYYFTHTADMPECANLVTFRNRSIQDIATLPLHHTYFRLWKGVTYQTAFVLWIASLIVLIIVSRRAAVDHSFTGLAIVLTGAGLLMFAATCFLTDDQPRFRLPMWHLLILSLFLMFGRIADLLAARGSPSDKLTSSEGSPPGSHCRSEP